MMSRGAVENIVERVIRERLSSEVVCRVIVNHDIDADGDEVLRVAIILKDEPDKLDRSRLVGLMRHIRSELAEVSDNPAFPILSFVSKSEARKNKYICAHPSERARMLSAAYRSVADGKR